jgi:hypothetical protein
VRVPGRGRGAGGWARLSRARHELGQDRGGGGAGRGRIWPSSAGGGVASSGQARHELGGGGCGGARLSRARPELGDSRARRSWPIIAELGKSSYLFHPRARTSLSRAHMSSGRARAELGTRSPSSGRGCHQDRADLDFKIVISVRAVPYENTKRSRARAELVPSSS